MMSIGTARQFIRKNSTAIIALSGHVGSSNCHEFQAECGHLQERLECRQVRNVVVDCSASAGLGCAALGLLLRLWKTTRRCHGQFSMCSLSRENLDLLRVVKLDGLWPIYDSRAAAIDAVDRIELVE